MNKVITPFSTRILESSSLDNFWSGSESPATFSLVVLNRSLAYASFYLRLKAAGERDTAEQNWYRVTPGQSYSIGPNDCVKFNVEIFKLPPGREDFIGTLSLQVETISQELAGPENPNIDFLSLHVVGKAEPAVAVAKPAPAAPLLLSAAEALPVPAPKKVWLYGLGLAGIALLLMMLLLRDHRATVTDVQLAPTLKVVSGAENGTLLTRPAKPLIRWKRTLSTRSSRDSVERHRAIEVVRFNPEDSNQVAVGFKNGDIALYNLKGRGQTVSFKRNSSLCNERNDYPIEGDRVFDLVFYQSKLYSAHGSGRVLAWNISGNNKGTLAGCLQKAPNKTVTSMTIVTIRDNVFLAIAGQYNHLSLINLSQISQEPVVPLPDLEAVSRYRHITSLSAVAEDRPFVATGDDRGNIALWNLAICDDLTDQSSLQKCEPTASWRGHNNKPIRDVALSKNGDYLVSGGDDGHLRLWSLTFDGDLFLPTSSEVILRRSREWLLFNPFKPRSIETVDLIAEENNPKLFIASGGEDGKVHIQRYRPKIHHTPQNGTPAVSD